MSKKVIKNPKITKRTNFYKDYATTYNVQILNSFNPEIQLKNTESVIRNIINHLLTELTGFKFVKN